MHGSSVIKFRLIISTDWKFVEMQFSYGTSVKTRTKIILFANIVNFISILSPLPIFFIIVVPPIWNVE